MSAQSMVELDEFRYELFVRKLSEWYGVDVNGDVTLVADIGAGQFMPFSRILSNNGKKVFAVDSRFIYGYPSFPNWFNSLRYNGIRGVLGDVLADSRGFRRRLQEKIDAYHPKSRSSGSIKVEHCQAEDLKSIGSETCDLVFSFSTLEHVIGVESAIKETKRILKTNGISFHDINLYASLNGDHNGQYLRAKHWSHLVDNAPISRYSTLNGWPSTKYIEVFGRYFVEVRYERYELQPELRHKDVGSWLTPEVISSIENAGGPYPIEDLLHTEIVVAGKKVD